MKQRILVVEDMEDNLELFRDMLEISGYEVLCAGDGLTAVRLAHEHQPDLVLMDISLPGIDGHEATRRILAHGPTSNTPVIAVTAHAMPLDRERALAAGCVTYLAKPVSPRVLLQVVASYINHKS